MKSTAAELFDEGVKAKTAGRWEDWRAPLLSTTPASVTAKGGGMHPVVLKFEEVTVVPGQKSLVPLIALGAGAVLAVGVGIGLGTAARGAQDEVEQKRTGLTSPCPTQPSSGACKEIADAAARHDAMVPAAIGLFATAGLLGAATLTYGLWPRTPPVTAAIGMGPQGASLLISGSF